MQTRAMGGLLAACALFICARTPGEEPPRVGFEENFDTADGWKVSDGAPLKALAAKDGVVRFETVCGALNAKMKRPDWPEWPEKPFESNTTVKKTYGKQIDLGKYHYLLVKLDERGTAVTLAVCGSWTPICYTTGLRAFDLRNRGIDDKRDLALSIQFLNTSGAASFDFVRLVSELTEDEKKVLMPAPAEYFAEKRAAHPYHKLEALNARAGRTRLKEAEGQLTVYTDTLSNGTVWKLTNQPGDQAFMSNDKALGWTNDGRYFRTVGGVDGRNVFDHAAGAWRKTAGGDAGKPLPEYNGSWESSTKPGVVYGYRTQWKRPQCDFLFFRFDQATGEETELARITTDGKWDVRELSRAEKSDRAVLGLRGTPNVWIVDPDAAEPAARAKAIVLKTRLKGVGFAKDDTTLQWHNCYTYEHWEMNIETGETHLGYYTGGGHAGGGFGKTLRHYEGLTTMQPAGLTDWKAGDAV
ncbi:MAG: hypothetical protein HY291_10070, partial [Planctomycetes bacterium]|nr:hypothetical protein [Planctomycetota bacterium]